MEEIIEALKRNRSQITQQDYSKIIRDLQELGYGGRPERWHQSKKAISVVLPEKIQWFIDNDVEVDAEQIRAVMLRRGVRLQ